MRQIRPKATRGITARLFQVTAASGGALVNPAGHLVLFGAGEGDTALRDVDNIILG